FIEFPKIIERRKVELDDFVFSSRVRIVRNIEGLTFPHLLSENERTEIDNKLSLIIKKLPYEIQFEKIESMEKDLVMIYITNHVLTREFITNGRILAHDDNGSWVILLNEDDHICIYSIENGYNIKTILARLLMIISEIEDKVDFSYDEEMGYLTSSVLNVGTGLRLSALVNLHGIVSTKKIEKFIETANAIGYSIININKENSESGLFYVYNIYSLGLSEDEMAADFKQFLLKTLNLEIESREEYFNNKEELEISLEEVFELSIKEKMDWSTMLYYISLIDSLNKKYIEIEELQKFRNLIYTAHDDYLFYKNHIEKEFLDKVRMNMIKYFISHIKYRNLKNHLKV
ncbi:MAG: hypothetical protein A2355_10470, partial [Spirochaetes bacterium RIFOXYB1_FULL_32_8]